MPISMPAWMQWNRNTACIASRTGSLPRNAKLRFETPPEIWACGRVSRIVRVASMKATP